ncbi:TonB-dependent receptor [Jiulongibacter sediminis]|uniref:TonB-dependent receptor n=1 Tax=Jiulongibacter sediminis TaxID=1605367 RepID=A0A0N8H989_9BACT|nr:TonB-dependent receptor plug domain-containing protein [Jiulongibacter sediminis]KPM46700.1 TonB-dependent receptor [Jiulongibacter sediminis]TBX21605.1 TonB-dependent receptor [Jiulongibacter sediminis]
MKTILIILITLTGQLAWSQNFSGKVTDEQGQPLPGVTVQNLQTGAYSHTDFNGVYRISESQIGDSLKVSLMGFEKANLVLSENSNDIVLSQKTISLDGVEVRRSIDAQSIFADVNLQTNPVNSSQDLLRLVPGLFTGQHAGGGKAEQIFLRGFDIDHGTDLFISVDGLPVNMVSHAHGQGYSDLHFVIPETVEGVEFSKGSYKADQGNFATAGSVSFQTKDHLDQSNVKLEYGQFNHRRLVGMLNLTPQKSGKTDAYLATEYLYDDGPFESPQKLGRFNALAKVTTRPGQDDKLTFSSSYFDSDWNASGQIPQRAVNSGLITRFGAIDDTEGGATSRLNSTIAYDKALQNQWSWNSKAYYTYYDFELYSNFTFFAANPVAGDQIRQKEHRNLFGAETAFSKETKRVNYEIKAGLRSDLIRGNQLARTQNKTLTLENIYLGDINETNAFVNLDAEISAAQFTFIPGLRLDQFLFNYRDNLGSGSPMNSDQAFLASPKLSVVYQTEKNQQFFIKTGYGYHSNDSRAAVQNFGRKTLPRSFGADLGSILKVSDKLLINPTLWYLYLQQEFVYVGDEGIVEPSGRTRRMGADLSVRAELAQSLFFDTDFTYSNARSIDDPAGQNYIPLAPQFTWTAGLSLMDFKGFSAGLKTRMLGNRPANEDYNLVAEGYWITDANVNYAFGKIKLGVQVQNLFNTSWNETQFATESRLRNELNPVEEIHFTPGTPFNLRTTLTYSF